MRKVFLDCGAHCGCSRRYFRTFFDTNSTWEIFSFEPNPLMSEFCADLIPKAVSTRDGTKTLFQYYKTGGSTINRDKDMILMKKVATTMKTEIRLRRSIQVDCIDLDRWVKEQFSPDDFIWLKLDVEGSEYEVLEHMIENGSIDYINKIDIEWHDIRCKVHTAHNLALTQVLERRGINVYTGWDAMSYDFCKYPK